MRRRDISKALLASAAGSTLLTRQVEAQTYTPPYFPLTKAEYTAGVTPTNYAYNELNILRYYPGSGHHATAINNALLVSYRYSPFAAVTIPSGTYATTSAGVTIPILLKNGATLVGAGSGATRINNVGATGRIIQNFDSDSFNNVTIKGVAFYGSQYGIFATTPSGQEQLFLEDVAFVLQSIGAIVISNSWQVNTLRNVVMASSGIGIQVGTGPANLNNYESCQFNSLDGRSIAYQGTAEVNNFTGCRFESVANAVNPTIPVVAITGANNGMAFKGCYFEGCHKTLLEEAAGTNSTSYDDCHFTGGAVEAPDSADESGLMRFIFSTGASEVRFGTNTWFIKSLGPTRHRQTGNNQHKLARGRAQIIDTAKAHQKFVSASTALTPTSQTVSAVTLIRTLTDSTISDLQFLSGILRVNYFRATAVGITNRYSAYVPVSISGIAAAAIAVTYGTPVVSENTGGETFTFGSAGLSSTAGTLTIAIAAMPVAATCVLQWAFECESGATPTYEPMIASLP